MKRVDPGAKAGVDLVHSVRAPRGPASDIHRATGPLSLAAQTEIRCQVKRRDGRCDRRLAVVDGDAVARSWTVDSLDRIQEGEHGAWCARCRRGTVYIVRSE